MLLDLHFRQSFSKSSDICDAPPEERSAVLVVSLVVQLLEHLQFDLVGRKGGLKPTCTGLEILEDSIYSTLLRCVDGISGSTDWRWDTDMARSSHGQRA